MQNRATNRTMPLASGILDPGLKLSGTPVPCREVRLIRERSRQRYCLHVTERINIRIHEEIRMTSFPTKFIETSAAWRNVIDMITKIEAKIFPQQRELTIHEEIGKAFFPMKFLESEEIRAFGCVKARDAERLNAHERSRSGIQTIPRTEPHRSLLPGVYPRWHSEKPNWFLAVIVHAANPQRGCQGESQDNEIRRSLDPEFALAFPRDKDGWIGSRPSRTRGNSRDASR
jgi:hypothetical protein